MQLGLDVLPAGTAPPGTGALPAPVAGLNLLALRRPALSGRPYSVWYRSKS
jgi:hypothetical protein